MYIAYYPKIAKCLDLTTTECLLLELIYTRSEYANNDRGKWCYMAKKKMGDNLNLTERAIYDAIEKLVKKEYIIKNSESPSHLRTSLKYKELRKMKESDEDFNKICCPENTEETSYTMKKLHTEETSYITEETSYETMKKLHNNTEETSYNNNNNNIKEEEEEEKTSTSPTSNFFDIENKIKIPSEKELKDYLKRKFPNDDDEKIDFSYSNWLSKRSANNFRTVNNKPINDLYIDCYQFASQDIPKLRSARQNNNSNINNGVNDAPKKLITLQGAE